MRTKKVKIDLPENLSAGTQSLMRLVIKELTDKKVLSAYDTGNMWTLADSYEQYTQASSLLLQDGSVLIDERGRKYLHPAERLKNANYNRYIQIMTEYGLTPKSRGKIKSMVPDAEAEDSPLRKLLSGKL